MKKLKNLSKLRIKGLNQERVISKLSKFCKIFNFNRIEKNISEFEVKTCDLKKVKGQLVSDGFEVEVLKTQGIALVFKRLLSSYGIIAGMVLSILFYFCQFGLIWQVNVYGNDVLSSDEIVEFVNENFPKSKNQIDTEQVEIMLKENFRRISSVSVSIVGQSLVVNINESLLPPEMQGDFSPIYSEVDCKISEINLIQGTLAVKRGDIVQKGEVLVYPYIFDSQGEKREVKPMAEIKAQVWLIGEVEHSDSFLQTYRTGEKLVCDEITLFGLPIYSHKSQCEFQTFEVEESQQYLAKNNILPFILNKKVYYETKTQLIEKTFEEVKEEKIQEAKQKALIYFDDCDIIESEDVNINSLAGVTNLEYIITVQRAIGVTYEDLHEEGGAGL